MKPNVALLLLALCAEGCATKPCRDGTVYLTLDYAGVASAADAIRLDVTVGDSHQGYTRPRTPGAAKDALEIDFRAYPRAATVVIAATATHGGQTIGAGLTQATLAAGCTALTLDVGAATTSGDDAAADLAVDAHDLAGADLTSAPPDLTVVPPDLAVVPPDLAPPATTHDLAMAPPHDLAIAPVVVDLAVPIAPPDLAQPIVDMAQPPVIGFSGESDTPQMPNSTNYTAFTDACPAGQAMFGFNLAVATDTSGNQLGVNRADTLCAVPAVKPAVGGGWTVVWEVGPTLPGHGTADQATVAYQCNTNAFLVGFGGRSGLYLDKLLISCASILVDGNGNVSVGPTSDSNTGVGGTGGSAFANIYCPAGQVATMLRTRDQAGSAPNAFGYGCSTPVVTK